MPMSLWRRKGRGGRGKGGVESQKYDLLSAQTPEKWSFLCTSRKNRSIFFATVDSKALESERQGLKSQVQSEPFDTTLVSLALGDVKIFLKSGYNFGVGTLCKVNIICVWEMSCNCCESCSQVLQPKARSPCGRQCPDASPKNRRTGNTCYLCRCHKGLLELMLSPPWKQRCKGLQRGGIILKLAPSQDQTSTWGLNYFLAVWGGSKREQNGLHTFPWSRWLPTVVMGLSQEGWGLLCPRILFRPGCSWLSLEYLFPLKCCLVLVFFSSFHSDLRLK